jgi:hypothetical protein
MTAIRNFPDAPLAQRSGLPLSAYVPGFAVKVWLALHRFGQLRAARELELLADRRALGEPLLARRLRAAASECRRGAMRSPAAERSAS